MAERIHVPSFSTWKRIESEFLIRWTPCAFPFTNIFAQIIGTILIPGTGKEKVIVEPSKSDREGFESHPIQIHAGDEIILGKNTHYVVIEGLER